MISRKNDNIIHETFVYIKRHFFTNINNLLRAKIGTLKVILYIISIFIPKFHFVRFWMFYFVIQKEERVWHQNSSINTYVPKDTWKKSATTKSSQV